MSALPRVLAFLAIVTIGLAHVPGGASQGLVTFYETPPMTPRNMDYDAANKTFRAHAGWIDDRLVHYYKFQMYTPDTYPEHVKPGETPRIPIAPVYLPTTDGTLNGTLGKQPVLRYHTKDGANYSDFVHVHLVNVSNATNASMPRSYAEVMDLNVTPMPTGILVNMPVVPTGSSLEDPVTKGDAPIMPLMVWYNGTEVQTFTFETSSQALADMWNPLTRTTLAARNGSGYEMTVARLASGDSVSFLPIWHVNQYFEGVTPGVNSGGPASTGMRNVIDADRLDPGYSPLWQVYWISQLPPDYEPDHASDADQFTQENGFSIIRTPMYVNCPNVGPHGGSAPNTAKLSAFERAPRILPGSNVTLQGALVMEGGKNVTARIEGVDIANATTNMMGAYLFRVDDSTLAEGANSVEVVGPDGLIIAEWTLLRGDTVVTPTFPPTPPTITPPTPPPLTPTATPTGTPAATPPTPSPTPEAAADTPVPLVVALAALGVAAFLRRR